MTTQRLTSPVLGMTCASCISTIEGAWRNHSQHFRPLAVEAENDETR